MIELSYNFDEDDEGIFNLEGLQYATNLEVIRFTEFDNLANPQSNISDLSPLADLTKLRVIDFRAGGVQDLSPLKNLVGLEELRLPRGSVSDISVVENFKGLKILGLLVHQISDLSPLRNVPSLEELYLSNNQISDLGPLANLTKLERLFLDNNQISDLGPLQRLTNLAYLALAENRIEDIAPLLDISTWGRGDIINLEFNLLETCPGTEDRAALETLRATGAEVLFFVSEDCGAGNGGETCAQSVEVADPVLEREIRARLNKSEAEGALTCADLESFSELVIQLDDINDLAQSVTSFEGFQFATNLGVLEITGAVSIEADLEPLLELGALKSLVLQNVFCGNEDVIGALRERGVTVQIVNESDCSG